MRQKEFVVPVSMLRICSVVWLVALAFQFASYGAEEEQVSRLFQQLLIKEKDDYVKARDELLAHGEKLRPFLKQTAERSPDWREKVASKILLGWLDHPELYAELSSWHVTPGLWRNPFPFYEREARLRFYNEKEKAIPIMLELIWKKEEAFFGALPILLAQAKVELALPVLVRMKTIYPAALGEVGALATPYILEVLPASNQNQRTWLIQALGRTGGEKAVAELRARLKSDKHPTAREEAATSLGRLGEFAILRSEYAQIEGLEIRLAMLKAFSKDHSDETRALLTKVATTAPRVKDGELYNTERLRAVQSMLEDATDQDIVTVCKIAPTEPHEYTRGCFYLYLARPNVSLIREALLQALQDPGPSVQLRAIDFLRHYPDDLVTERVLEVTEKTTDAQCRRVGIFVLKDRASPRVRQAAENWLKDKDPEIQRWATEVLAQKP